ncbi:hypothetical protein [Thiomonas sp.]
MLASRQPQSSFSPPENQALEPDLPVVFLSRKVAEALPGTPGMAIISITNPGKRLADLPGYLPTQVLRLSFDDADELAMGLPFCLDPVAAPLSGLPAWVWSGIEWFSPRQAEAIRVFVERQSLDTRFRVHCEKGQSRSAAVARWIAGYRKLPEPPGISIPNGRVLRVLQQVSG